MAFKATQIYENPSSELGADGQDVPSAFNPEVASMSSEKPPPTDFKGVLCAEFLTGKAAKDAEQKAKEKQLEVSEARQRLESLPEGADISGAAALVEELERQAVKLTEDAAALAEPVTGHKSFVQEMYEKGIKVTKFSIEDIKINDAKLASAMSQAALLNLEQAKAKADSAAAVSRADGEAKVRKREAEGKADAKRIETEAEYKAKIRLAEAEQEEIRKISEAISSTGPLTDMWSQWKLTSGAGQALESANATIMLTPNVGEISSIMAASAGVNAAQRR